ncbi:hypothetical protein OOK41_00170 [Micromonospora sp. NBC_01655]|uniref:hypothetical protein n=1 Tax=Micromonospora sp. NBC_01655 TaxID=2975983 RepID=UPI00225C30C0|nr:hypothetical protein [Micromonospora sp. NBC_01655]MCX4468746.1 hypothetical protein [Micromonospora sp. NBC_01655]
MNVMDANALLMGGGVKSVNWKDNPIGHTVIGTIAETPKVEQMKKFNSDELDFWPSGDPKMQIVVTLQTDQRDPANEQDDGKRRLHISPRMMSPVREAVQRIGAKGLEIGGRLAVRRVGGSGAVGDPYTFAAEYGAPAIDPAASSVATVAGNARAGVRPGSADVPAPRRRQRRGSSASPSPPRGIPAGMDRSGPPCPRCSSGPSPPPWPLPQAPASRS